MNVASRPASIHDVSPIIVRKCCGRNQWFLGQRLNPLVTIALIVSVLFGLSKTPVYAQGGADGGNQAPFAVLTIPPFSTTVAAPVHAQFARVLSERLCAALKSKGLPVLQFPIEVDTKRMDDPQALLKLAARKKVAWLLRCKIVRLDFEQKTDFFQTLHRTNIELSVELIDPNGLKPIKTYTSHGLRSIRVLPVNGIVPSGSIFTIDANGDAYALNAAQECLYGDGKNKRGLAGDMAADYPNVPWKIPTITNPIASLRVKVQAGTREKAAQVGVGEIVKKLFPTPNETVQRHLKEVLVPNATQLVQVEETSEKDSYQVIAPIQDSKGLVLELKRLGDLQLLTLGVIASNETVQEELRNALAKAGFIVKDEQRLAALRNRTYVEGMLDGKTDPLVLQTLKDVSNAFAYMIVADGVVESTGGRNGQFSALARVRVKILDPNTSEVLPGASESDSDEDETQRAAGERALKTVTGLVITPVLEELYNHVTSSTGTSLITMRISGWKKASDAEHFRQDLAKVAGVSSAEREAYEAGILTLKVELTREARKTLATTLEEEPNLKKYSIGIDEDKGTTINGKRDADASIPSNDPAKVEKTGTTTDKTQPQKTTTKDTGKGKVDTSKKGGKKP